MAGKKKKGKKEKKPKEDDDKLAAVDKTFYELTIVDLNNKLARLRTHSSKLEETNEDLTERLRRLDEDRTDITAFLDRNLAEKKDTIKEMNEQLIELSKVREDEAKESANKIKEWEQRYKATQEQLSSEIKLLNGKLNSLEEFRVQKDELMAKFDSQENHLKQQQNMHKEVLYEMERKMVLDKAHLKKDVENRLLKLSDDFTKTGEIRVAAYTQRLIRENIALNNEMDKMIVSQRRMEHQHKEIVKRNKEFEELFEINEAIKQQLIKTCESQVKVIERLMEQFDVLKARYGKIHQYKSLYEDLLKRDTCDRFTLTDMNKKILIMSQRIEMVKSEKARLLQVHQLTEAEVVRLNNIIKTIKFTVQSTIRNMQDKTADKSYRRAQRKNLLFEIMQIITTYADETVPVPSVPTISGDSSIYGTGAAGLMQRSESLLQLFKREAQKVVSAEALSPELQHKNTYGKIIPRPRVLDSKTLFDVESGTTFVASAAYEDEVADDFDDDNENDYGNSSSAEQSAIAPSQSSASPEKEQITELTADGGKAT